MSAHDRPTGDQIMAADPAVSAWVGANAGSGKTRVLTQRVARLLLEGNRPERILCLTYTKAAAAEMQTRLFGMLGAWAMEPDADLGRRLAALEGSGTAVADPARLAAARRLFAAALETPGGLRIQTIHAFCDAMLRRFPLEAGVSPRFEVLDDRQKALMIEGILSDMAAAAEAGTDPAFDLIASRLNDGGIADLVAAILPERDGFDGPPVRERIAAHLGEAALRSPAETARAALDTVGLDGLGPFAELLAREGGKTDQALADAIRAARAPDMAPEEAVEALLGALLTGKREPRSRRGFPVKKVLEADPEAEGTITRLLAWAEETEERLRAVETAARAADLHAFASGFLARYEAIKAERALLDFDDLVARARDLLTRSEAAAWALWKMDGGIDHILVDEAQDTAPVQWEVIDAVTREFHAGESAGRGRRSLFVVGDEKQSIYSFQGADPQSFGRMRKALADWLEGMGRSLERPELATSFRSAPGILRFVDAVFEGDAARGLTVDATPVTHEAHRARDTARIDLWPLVEPAEAEGDDEWWQPVDRPPEASPKLRLARALGAEIARMVAEDRLPPRDGAPGRRVRPGDILVLVSRRDLLAEALIRALKARGVPVAGSDRLTLAGELAVRDLMALAKVALTPGDDLSLAALLRSPIFGLSEEELFALAVRRGKGVTLLSRLRAARERHPEAVAILEDLAGRADYLRPYEFLQRALTRHDARRRLIARLGTEAEDPIDELLEQALAFEARETPSLAGFIAWVEAGEVQVKREMEGGADQVRVMTVHGAKGLEAPVVVLPDTMAEANRGGGRQRLYRIGAEGGNAAPLVAWAGASGTQPAAVARAREEAERLAEEERKRLLYVALTRAEDWLILCGAAGRRSNRDKTWYGLIEAGAGRLDGWVEREGPLGPGVAVRRLETGPDGPVAGSAARGDAADEAPEPPSSVLDDTGSAAAAPGADRRDAAARGPDPAWLTPARAEERTRRLSPSDLAPHDEAGGGAGLGREAAMLYGSAVHLVLERLASHDAGARARLAPVLLAGSLPELDPALAAAAIAEAEGVLAAPFAAEVFGPGALAEVAIAARSDPARPAGPELRGRIDRLVVGAERVLAVDFKTDALGPGSPAEVKPGYLAQLGAYRAALAPVYPGRRIETAILWTAGPSLMALPDAAVDAAFAAALREAT